MPDYPLTTVHAFLENSSEIFAEKTAIVHESSRLTYSEINSMANSLATWLREFGLNQGEKVVILMENCPEYISSYYGIMKAGMTAVPMGTDIKPETLTGLIEELESKVVISNFRFEKTLNDAGLVSAGVRAVILKDQKSELLHKEIKVFEWGQAADLKAVSNPGIEIDPASLASIIYTSGSTGLPKGVMLTHKNICCNVDSICKYLKLTEKDIQMVVLPFFYVMGKSLLNTHFAVGGTVVINNKFAYPATVINQMIEENVTGFSGVPSTFAYLLHRSPLAKSRDRLKSLRYCSQAGGHMSRPIKEELRRVLPEHTDIYIMYGATEASARLSYLEPEMFERKIDSIGRAIPGVSMKVVDPGGNELPPREQGEIVGSGDNIMQGYWKDEETTSKVLDENGYHTGDMGYMDEDGYFYLSGRKDNLLKVGGHRINTQEVEDALMDTGLVTEVIVLGVPDKLLGNKLIALITPRPREIAEIEIMQKLSAGLPKYKIPSEIKFTRSLPKKASGKIDRNGCLELVNV